MNRNLFKYVEFTDKHGLDNWMELSSLFKKIGLDPEYYLVVDSTSDLPYDFYRAGEEEERLPILLLMPNGELFHVSRILLRRLQVRKERIKSYSIHMI